MITSTENFQIEIDADGILVASLCVPGRSMNTITAGVIRDLEQLLARCAPKSASKAWC